MHQTAEGAAGGGVGGPSAQAGATEATTHVQAMVQNMRLTAEGSTVGASGNTLPAKLHWLFSAVAARFCSPATGPSVSVVQAWLPSLAPGSQEYTLSSEPRVAVVSDPRFAQFRLHSCHTPVMFKNSMTGRVWRTGAVQVVQNLRLVPPTMHPRVYLTDSDLDVLGEALYIPVYDSTRPGAGPMTVLEVLLPAHSQDPICSADLLSFISAGLATLKLSVSNPEPQPVKRSALCGRRARAAADSAPDIQQPASPQGAAPSQPAPNTCQPVAEPSPSVVTVPAPTPVIKAISGPSATPSVAVEDTAEQRATRRDSSAPNKQSDSPHTQPCASRSPQPAKQPEPAAAVAASARPDEDERVPRKVRKLDRGISAGRPAAHGLVRSQSSFHIVAASAAHTDEDLVPQ